MIWFYKCTNVNYTQIKKKVGYIWVYNDMAKCSQQVKRKTLLTNQQAENEVHLENDWGGGRESDTRMLALLVWGSRQYGGGFDFLFCASVSTKNTLVIREKVVIFLRGGKKPLIINSQWPLRTTAFNVIRFCWAQSEHLGGQRIGGHQIPHWTLKELVTETKNKNREPKKWINTPRTHSN